MEMFPSKTAASLEEQNLSPSESHITFKLNCFLHAWEAEPVRRRPRGGACNEETRELQLITSFQDFYHLFYEKVLSFVDCSDCLDFFGLHENTAALRRMLGAGHRVGGALMHPFMHLNVSDQNAADPSNQFHLPQSLLVPDESFTA